MQEVGFDYLKMMEADRIQQFDKDGRLAREIRSNAKSRGIELKDVERCKLKGYHALACITDIEPGQSRVISVHNPNLKPLNGLILKVNREASNLSARVLNPSMSGVEKVQKASTLLEIETICTNEVYSNHTAQAYNKCEVFLDVVIKGLSIVYIKVDVHQSQDTDHEVLIPETMYSFSPKDYINDPVNYPRENKTMISDAKISIVDG